MLAHVGSEASDRTRRYKLGIIGEPLYRGNARLHVLEYSMGGPIYNETAFPNQFLVLDFRRGYESVQECAISLVG